LTDRWEVAVEASASLGEGPAWDPTGGGRLWFVDINGQCLYRFQPRTGELATLAVDGPISAVIPRSDGSLGLAIGDGIQIHRWGQPPSSKRLKLRGASRGFTTNDAKCDPEGRLWIGTIPVEQDDANNSSFLMRIDENGVTVNPTPRKLANGLGWSPNGETMYFVDSRNRTVSQFEYDGSNGEASHERVWLEVPETAGWADGITVDAEGGVWVAMYLGGAVHRYDAGGTLTDVIELPVSKVTSVCFGGDRLQDLYITSASVGLTDEQTRNEPLAGSTFVVPGLSRGCPVASWAVHSLQESLDP
jgi:sugar lactone lactonase YvrE